MNPVIYLRAGGVLAAIALRIAVRIEGLTFKPPANNLAPVTLNGSSALAGS
jgi:hypothetical protein